MQIPSYLSTRLHYQHKALIDILDGLSDEQVRRNIIPGKWSIFEHIVHLQAYQHLTVNRIKQIIAETNPCFDRYTADADPIFLDNCHLSTREIMQDLITTRKEMATDLLQLADKDYEKVGTHPHFGVMNIVQWINFFVLHEGHHQFAIFKLVAEFKRSQSMNVYSDTSTKL